MRGLKLVLFFPPKIEDQKKDGLHVRRCRVFTENIGELDQFQCLIFISLS